MTRRRYEIVNDFIKFAFYDGVPEGLEINAIYESYRVYCKLFDIDESTKFDFIQEFIDWRG